MALTMAARSPLRRIKRWWRFRPFLVSVWDAANAERWAAGRTILLKQRGITEKEANDVTVP